MESDYDEFEYFVEPIRGQTEMFLLDQFGEKCNDYDEGCECCQRWKAFEDLFENPYKE